VTRAPRSPRWPYSSLARLIFSGAPPGPPPPPNRRPRPLHDATLSSVVQAAWGVVLGRYGDTRDVVFGAVVSGRSPEVADIERIAGLLINTVPVRITYEPQDTFATLVARVQRQAVESQPHHAAKLADIQGKTELRAGLIKHLVVFENYPASQVGAGSTGLTAKVVETSEPTTYDLILVVEPGDSLRLELQYNARAYTREQVTALASHLARFLSESAKQPKTPIVGVSMLDQAERDYLVLGLNQTARPYPSTSTLAAQFSDSVQRHGARTAINADDVNTTYTELDQRSNRLAHHLAANGVTAGDRVGILLERSPVLIDATPAFLKPLPGPTLVLLTPDFLRKPGAPAVVVAAKPDVFNHNLETVPGKYLTVRPGARYFHSLRLLQRVKELDPTIFTKSGIMVGLGEERNEILQLMDDLRSADVDFITIGQYLAPSRKHHAVIRFVTPEAFKGFEAIAYVEGFPKVFLFLINLYDFTGCPFAVLFLFPFLFNGTPFSGSSGFTFFTLFGFFSFCGLPPFPS